MSGRGQLTADQIENLALETFARQRGTSNVLTKNGDVAIDLQIVKGKAISGKLGTSLTIRLFVFDDEGIRDAKEQEVLVIPPGTDHTLLPAYFEGIVQGLRALAERSDLASVMPVD